MKRETKSARFQKQVVIRRRRKETADLLALVEHEGLFLGGRRILTSEFVREFVSFATSDKKQGSKRKRD